MECPHCKNIIKADDRSVTNQMILTELKKQKKDIEEKHEKVIKTIYSATHRGWCG